MAEDNFDIMPAHIFKPLHPKYNTDMDYKKFANSRRRRICRRSPRAVRATEYKTDELLIMRRNPYF